jgi:oligopeptide/dipeptide ABC transporter ATP-binding protein
MALSCNPALLICDEPTTSLDVTVQAQLLEIIDDLRARFGTSVITITHNLGIVARYVDRVNVMYAGKMVETAPTEDLYANPCHPYTIGLLSSVPRLDVSKKKSLRMIKGLPPNLAHLPGGCSFHPRCDYAMPKCKEEYPPLEKVGDNHYRACWAELSKLKRQ